VEVSLKLVFIERPYGVLSTKKSPHRAPHARVDATEAPHVSHCLFEHVK
jgi:hypothetical protein